MAYLQPKKILVEFLRTHLTDPRSSRSDGTKTESFTATAGQTDFSLTPDSGDSFIAVTSVTVGGTSQEKWSDYYVFLDDNKVVFTSGLSSGDSVSITYKQGTNWIYWDKPYTDLTESSWPRISVMNVSTPGRRLGSYQAPIESTMSVQVDLWAKEKIGGQIFTIGGTDYYGENLVEYLAWKIYEDLEDNEGELHPLLYNYVPTQMPRDMPFNEEYQAHHKILEFDITGLSLGRVD